MPFVLVILQTNIIALCDCLTKQHTTLQADFFKQITVFTKNREIIDITICFLDISKNISTFYYSTFEKKDSASPGTTNELIVLYLSLATFPNIPITKTFFPQLTICFSASSSVS